MLEYEPMFGTPHRIPWVIAAAGFLMLQGAGAQATGLHDEAVGYRTEGYAQQQAGDWDNAYEWYQKAVALDPTYATPYNDLGVLLEHERRLEEAEHAYLKALELNPDYPEAHGNLAMLYEVLGKPQLAAQHWLRRYQLGKPGDVWTQHAASRLVALGLLGSASLRTPDTGPALASILPASPAALLTPDRRRDWSQLVEQELAQHGKSVEAFHRFEHFGGVQRP